MASNTIPLHGGQLSEIAERFSVPKESLLDFSASISPIPPGDAVIAALCESLRNRDLLTQYPDTEYRDLKDAIGTYAGLDRSSICVANGVMPLLDAAVRALRLRRCLVLAPAFGEYQRILTACGADSPKLLLREDNNFLLDPDLIVKEVMSSRADAILFANPHSPSGSLTLPSVLIELQRMLYRSGIVTILDEAFIDYCPECSISGLAGHLDGLVVLRSLTKFFAIPGLRVAYAVACDETCTTMESRLPLWPVDSLAASAARLVLLDRDGRRERQEINSRERHWLFEQLSSLGWQVFPGNANYLLIKPPGEIDGQEIWRRLIVKHRIVVRNCGTFDGLTDGHFRIAVRDHLSNQTLTSSLAHLF